MTGETAPLNTPDELARQTRSSLNKIIVRPEVGVTIGLVVVWLIFYILSPRFLEVDNIGSILTVASETGIIAVGMAFLLISGEFDLSVGTVYVVIPTLMIRFSQWLGVPMFVGFIIGIAIAMFIGYVNGSITLRFGLPSFIVTLATTMLLGGILLALSGGFVTAASGHHAFFSVLALPVGYFRISTGWFIVIVLVFQFILSYTRYGNSVFATGGNLTIARKMGVDTNRVKMTNFIICAALAGVAGCISAARAYEVAPTIGYDVTFNAFGAGIIGGCLISGGQGSIVGTFIGVLLLSSVNSGLILAGASPYWYQAFVGAIILVVVIINLVFMRRAGRAIR